MGANHLDVLTEFDHTMFSRQLADPDKRMFMDYSAKLEAAYTHWLGDAHGFLMKGKTPKATVVAINEIG